MAEKLATIMRAMETIISAGGTSAANIGLGAMDQASAVPSVTITPVSESPGIMTTGSFEPNYRVRWTVGASGFETQEMIEKVMDLTKELWDLWEANQTFSDEVYSSEVESVRYFPTPLLTGTEWYWSEMIIAVNVELART
tara:strand:+ start:1198 stop:1617 length:420 start_codon:yes stop_codon:yes gene_type:complete